MGGAEGRGWENTYNTLCERKLHSIRGKKRGMSEMSQKNNAGYLLRIRL